MHTEVLFRTVKCAILDNRAHLRHKIIIRTGRVPAPGVPVL